MLIALEDGTALRGDFVIRAVQRYDLVPIPSTLELALRSDESLGGRVTEGSLIFCGSDGYRVVKMRRGVSAWVQSGGSGSEVLEITALLDGFESLAKRLQRAVIKESKSLGEIYRSCGARVRVTADVPVARFAALAGQFPTPSIAQALQEEAVAPVWRDSAMSFVRLDDLFYQRPIAAMQADTTQRVESEFLERHEIPWALSAAPGGAIIFGRKTESRGAYFLPRTPERVLRNVSRCLAVRRSHIGGLSAGIRAGDVVAIAGVPNVVTTAANTWDTGAGGGPSQQSTRMWLAEMSD